MADVPASLDALVQQVTEDEKTKPPGEPLTIARPDLAHQVRVCRDAIAFYEPTLRELTGAALEEYAVRRLIRDHYVRTPKALAADLHKYTEDYKTWWERWRFRNSE
jgi:hypothetical protein